MSDDLLARLRAFDDDTRRENERRKAERDAKEAITAEWDNCWNAVQAALSAGDEHPEVIPDLTPLIALAKLLHRRGCGDWIPEMANGISRPEILEDIGQFRPGQVWFLNLLIVAGQPLTTQEKLAAPYSFTPLKAAGRWRTQSADDILYFVLLRIENAENEKAKHAQEKAQEAAARKKSQLLSAAKKRPAIEKQLFSVHWNDHGHKPARIRDDWNRTHPQDPIGAGDPGREDIKSAIRRGREFLDENKTTESEMSLLLNFTHRI